MTQAYIQALLMILIAEMGDKTQILAMAFATKYKVRQIVMGVAIGAFLNHGLAILLGSMLTQFIPMDLMQLIAGFMFIFFAIWSLKVDEEEEEEAASKYGPVVTVALAFFLGELGDKTQLAALTLGASSLYPALVLAGTVTGMVLTSLLGIVIGMKLGHKIPEMQLKLGAFGIFMFFGLEKLITSPYNHQINPLYGVGILAIIGVISGLKLRKFVGEMRTLNETALTKQAQALYDHIHGIKKDVEALCLGEQVCETCQGSQCLVGFMKQVISKIEKREVVSKEDVQTIERLINREFDKNIAKTIMTSMLAFYDQYPESYSKEDGLRQLMNALERVIYGEVLSKPKQYDLYKKALIEKDPTWGLKKIESFKMK